MKLRKGFISNSSSSSFIVMIKDDNNKNLKKVPEGMTAKSLLARCIEADYDDDVYFPHLTEEGQELFDILAKDGYRYVEASIDWGGEDGLTDLAEKTGLKIIWTVT